MVIKQAYMCLDILILLQDHLFIEFCNSKIEFSNLSCADGSKNC